MVLYVTSWGDRDGKTSLCAGIGRWLQDSGKKVGYLKPLTLADAGTDKDGQFLKQALDLKESPEVLSPLRLSDEALKAELAGGTLGAKVKQSYSDVIEKKDVVLLEGLPNLALNGYLADASQQIVKTLDADVLIVVAYSPHLPWDRIASSGQRFARHPVGVVINRVPQNKMESLRSEMASRLDQGDVRILGMLPEDRLLSGIGVGELAERLQASILCCPEGATGLVQNVMIGALTVDSGGDYFRRKDSKVVIVRGDRPDMQLAALSTPTKCLVLSEGVSPMPQVLNWAEDKGVPLLLTKLDTLSVVAEVEQAFVKAGFRHKEKVERMRQILDRVFDFRSLFRGLGFSTLS